MTLGKVLFGLVLFGGLAWACGSAWYYGPTQAWMPAYALATQLGDLAGPGHIHDLAWDRSALQWMALVGALGVLAMLKLAWDMIGRGHHVDMNGVFRDGADYPLGHVGPFTWRRR